MTVKLFLYLLILVISLSCKSRVYIEEKKLIFNKVEIPLNTTPISEIEEQLGTNYETFNWNTFSTEYIYKRKGISFTCKQEDSIRRMVNWINVETSKNTINLEDRVTINKLTTVDEVVEQFENSSWDYDSTYSGLIIEYPYFDIIVRLTQKDKELLGKETSFEDQEKFYQLFKEHKIKGIEVF